VNTTVVSDFAANGEQEVPSVGQEVRPAMRSVLAGRIQSRCRHRSSTTTGNAINRAISRPEQNRVVGAPCSAARVRKVFGDHLHRSTVGSDLL